MHIGLVHTKKPSAMHQNTPHFVPENSPTYQETPRFVPNNQKTLPTLPKKPVFVTNPPPVFYQKNPAFYKKTRFVPKKNHPKPPISYQTPPTLTKKVFAPLKHLNGPTTPFTNT